MTATLCRVYGFLCNFLVLLRMLHTTYATEDHWMCAVFLAWLQMGHTVGRCLAWIITGFETPLWQFKTKNHSTFFNRDPLFVSSCSVEPPLPLVQTYSYPRWASQLYLLRQSTQTLVCRMFYWSLDKLLQCLRASCTIDPKAEQALRETKFWSGTY